MADRTLVASATNLLARGFLVAPTDRKTSTGEPCGALFTVARAIHRVFAFKLPARAIAVIDEAAPRASWPPLLAAQLPLVRPLLETLGLCVVVADDEASMVASYARAALAAGDDAIVVGMDKRFAQLVGDRLWWYDANKDARYTTEIVTKRFGVGPDQVAEWLALVGDDDGLPGIAGIGAKGATGLLQSHGTVAAALAAIDSITGRTGNALRADREGVIRELARARLDQHRELPVPLADCRFTPAATAARNALYERLGFVELLAADGESTQVTTCETTEQLTAVLATLPAQPIAVFPLGDPGALAGVALSAGDGAALYVPVSGLGPCVADHSPLDRWLADAARPKLLHAREGGLAQLRDAAMPLAGDIGDAAHASHLTQPSNWAPHDLPIIAKHALGRALPAEESLRGVGAKRKSWSAIAVDRAASLAATYADAIAAAWTRLSPAIAPTLLAEYHGLSEVCVAMEQCGLVVDRSELDRAEHDFAAIESGLQTAIEQLAGHSFNVNSSKQLGGVLFEELKLPIVSHTKTGWSTAIEALERIEHAHPIVPLVIRWRLLRRLRDSWIIALRDCIASDGRVHSRFHPARSFSGRLVNTNPDLGRVPGRTPEMKRIRRAFVAPPGMALLSVDYNQLGLHVLAHLTNDPALVEPLRRHDDLHVLTAEAVLQKPRSELTKEERQIGKVVNFATFAGQGASALALQLGITASEARELIERFDHRYADVRVFQDRQLALARERGYIETLAGRRWPIGGLESLDPHDRSYAERLARRATHEGSVADVSRRGLLDADRALRAGGLRARPVLQILDEVLFEVPLDELATAAPVAARAMQTAFALAAPLRVGLKAGPNWADLEPLESQA